MVTLNALTYTMSKDSEGDVVRTSVQARAIILTFGGEYMLMDDCQRVVGTYATLAAAKAYVPTALAWGYLSFR
jgi:hypothetical protein